MTKTDTPMLRGAARLLFVLINIFALYVLLRGHDRPGGGFIAGLASAISLILYSRAIGLDESYAALRVDPARLAAGGIALAVAASLAPMAAGRPFLEHASWNLWLPFAGELHPGTALAFDLGVFLVVFGTVVKVVIVLGYSTLGRPAFVASEERLYAAAIERPIEDARRARGRRPRSARGG